MFRNIFRRLRDNRSSREDYILCEVDKWLDSAYQSLMDEFDNVQYMQFGVRNVEQVNAFDDSGTGVEDQCSSLGAENERAEYSESILSQIDSIKRNVRAIVSNDSTLERTPVSIEVKNGVRSIEIAYLCDETNPLSYIRVIMCG